MKIVLVGAGKGGTGKTTVTSMLGKALSMNLRVALLDLDTQGPNLPRMVGVEVEGVECDDQWFYPKKFSGSLEVFSPAFLIPPGVACAWSGDKRRELIRELLYKVKWDNPDILLCDSPPGTSDEITAVLQYVSQLDGAIVVTTGKREALDDAGKLISLLQNRMYNVPIFGAIENMSYRESAGEHEPLFNDGIDVSEDLGIPVLAKILWKRNLRIEDGFDIVADTIIERLGLNGSGELK